ncbi:OmpA family protein [bacterium]|jgi:outer membrane protein OmpA-like peptidoglycan-associated protein|nr:OmpA family protein [bacterium]
MTPANIVLWNTTNNRPALPRAFHPMRDEGIGVQNHRLWNIVRIVASIFAVALSLSTVSGCLATRNWVNDQLNPVKSQLSETNAKADRALNGLQNLHLERQLVLNSSHGPTFAFGSAALTRNGKRQIDGFFGDLDGSTNPSNSGPASDRLFVIAGHTDNVGPESYNYELGLRRANSVAGYLVSKEGIDPTQIRVVSYGASKPVADNSTAQGRRSNRRVEILVYQQKITTGS